MLICVFGLSVLICSVIRRNAFDPIRPVLLISEETAEIQRVTPYVSTNPELPASPTLLPIEARENPSVYATITIQTDQKTKTFDIYPDVAETTLETHIGHLPSSVPPGEGGLCILMGHRDKELKILKHTKVGDVFTIRKNGTPYRFRVTHIDIQESDESLIFLAVNGSCLAIVTCYPFDIFGSAPQRITIYAKLP